MQTQVGESKTAQAANAEQQGAFGGHLREKTPPRDAQRGAEGELGRTPGVARQLQACDVDGDDK